jgi:hypothetical protein
MAHAGFYYNPYDSNPDNTTCFLCERSLDGWDGDDNPIEEHLRLSGDCGWAIMMDIQQHSSNPAEIEDPTSEKMAEARQATFSLSWPHDGKRGWVCKSEKVTVLVSTLPTNLTLFRWLLAAGTFAQLRIAMTRPAAPTVNSPSTGGNRRMILC